MEKRIGTIDPPEQPKNLPNNAQWLLGQGAGAWFSIRKEEGEGWYNIQRYSANGGLDCDRIFEVEHNGSIFDIQKPYEFTHLSHCARCKVIQNGIVFIFNYKED